MRLSRDLGVEVGGGAAAVEPEGFVAVRLQREHHHVHIVVAEQPVCLGSAMGYGVERVRQVYVASRDECGEG